MLCHLNQICLVNFIRQFHFEIQVWPSAPDNFTYTLALHTTNINHRPKSVVLQMPNKGYGFALSLNGWVEGHVRKGFVTPRAG
jgi:hypothetical protein